VHWGRACAESVGHSQLNVRVHLTARGKLIR
jgi:hypothetical protein